MVLPGFIGFHFRQVVKPAFNKYHIFKTLCPFLHFFGRNLSGLANRGLRLEAWAFRVAKINSLPQHSRTQNLTLLTCHADQLLFYIFFHLRSRHALLFNMHDTSAPHLIIFLDLTFTNNHYHLWELNLSGLKYLLTI